MLKEMVHVTSLSSFNACPYLFSQPQEPISPSNTFKWDMLNTVVCSNDEALISPYIKWFAQNIGFDFKEVEIMKKIFLDAKKMVMDFKSKHKQVYQESKMLYKYSDEYRIVGTPDIYYYDEERNLRCIRDWKYSTHSWYGNPEVTKTDMQKVVYALMVMEFQEVKEAEFGFICYDKKSWKRWEFIQEIIKYDEAKEITNKVMKEYITTKEFGEYQAKACNKCNGMCSVWKANCPLYKREVKAEEKQEIVLDF